MARAKRLLVLLQALRRRRRPASAHALADELGVSVRTVYRDIETLVAEGADIEGEAGVGYVLRPGFTLPPLMFDAEEIEALTLGCRWVIVRGDRKLAKAARDALAKIDAVLPAHARDQIAASPLIAAPGDAGRSGDGDLAAIRAALKSERKLRIDYADGRKRATTRIVWPIALAFFEEARVLCAWCELRRDFRHFRVDRIGSLTVLDERLAKRRSVLLKEWRAAQKIPDFTEQSAESKTADRN